MDTDVLELQVKHERELRERLEQRVKRLELIVRVLEFGFICLLLGQAPTIATFLGSVIR